MSERSHKRARTDDPPDQWGSLRQAWNASSLAEEVTELTESNEELTETLETCSQTLDYYKRLYEQATANCEQYKAGYQKQCARVEQLEAELKESQQAEAAAAKAHADDVQHKQELAAVAAAETKETIDALAAEVVELKRENNEYRGRTKTWRVRYEKLVERGAAALASKTVAEYGVTPDEVSLYKNFAAKQAEAARATEAVRQAAMQATKLGLKALQDA